VTITWPTPADISFGTVLSATQLDATASVPGSGTTVPGSFSYIPVPGALLRGGPQILTVFFTPTDTARFASTTASVQLNVTPADPGLTWAPAAITYGTPLSAAQLDASTSFSGSFSYTPALGAVLGGGAQTLSVSFTPTDTTDIAPGTLSVTLMVNPATPTLTWTDAADISAGTPLSDTQLDATASVAGTFTYTPAAGTVLSAGSGQTLSVSFTPADTTDYASTSATVFINVNIITATLTWATPADISYGTELSAAQLDASASAPGTIIYGPPLGTSLRAGQHTLYADFTPDDTGRYTYADASVQLNVTPADPGLIWATPAAITYGTPLSAAQLNATTTSGYTGTFTYTPPLGTVLSGGPQTLSVTFTPQDSTDIAPATLSVPIVVKRIPGLTWANPADISYGTPLSTTQLGASASVAGSFSYTPAPGAVLSAGNGQTLSVSFTPADATDYTTASATVTLNVDKATPSLAWANPADITFGTHLSATELNATAPVAGTFSYTPAAGTLLSAGNGQTLSVSFTPTDATDYTTASATVTLNVDKANPGVTWVHPTAIVFGTALSTTQLDATSPVAGTFVYTPAASTVLSAGLNQTLSATFMPTDTADYNTRTVHVLVNVNKANPSIIWTPPAAIVFGTALSATQLDATSFVAGKFVYTPAAGAVPSAGPNQTLSATFTPTDTADYNTRTVHVLLNVNKANPSITWIGPAAIVFGTALSATQLDATSPVAGSFIYTPAAGKILSAGPNQTLSATFTPTDTADYNTRTVHVLVNVNKANPSITWARPAVIVFGTALSATQLDAASPVAGKFVYTPAAGTKLSAGPNQTLSATFTPTDTADYNTRTVHVLLNVNKANPSITWTRPAAIVFGTALSATQLDAASPVAGSSTPPPPAPSYPPAITRYP